MSIKCHELSEAQLKVLKYAVQEIVSAEKTLILSIVAPLYERLLHLFRLAKDKIPRLSRATELMHLSRSSRNISPKHQRIGSMCSLWVRRNYCAGVTTPARC